MLVDWLIYGFFVFVAAKLLNATAFKEKPASGLVAWSLTILMFIVSVIIMSIAKVLRYEAISDSIGLQIIPQSSLDISGALLFAWLFFSILKRQKNIKQPFSAISNNLSKSQNTTPIPPKLIEMNEEDLNDELYETALNEIESGNTNKSLWAKAYALSEGDENKTRAKYIAVRAHQLNKELIEKNKLADEQAKIAEEKWKKENHSREEERGREEYIRELLKKSSI